MIDEKKYSEITDSAHIKKFAQFFTPEIISDFMAQWVIGGINKEMKILEPAFGLGIFSRSLLKYTDKVEIQGYELDGHILSFAAKNFANDKRIRICEGDFLSSNWEDKYDGIICNPPYLKFHDYANANVVDDFNSKLNLRLKKFINIYALFLIKSLSQLKSGGRCAFIIPSEFLNSDYGVEVKRFLLNLNYKIHIIIFDFKENIFDEAVTTASIILCERNTEYVDIKFSVLESPQGFNRASKNCKTYSLDEIDPSVKWRTYYDTTHSPSFKDLTDFSNFAKVSRGIATGSNQYFTMNRAFAIAHNIPSEAMQKCVCHSADITTTIFTQKDFDLLSDKGKTLYLFKGQGNENYASVSEYLQMGEHFGINNKYLCSKRSPWYALEKRVPAPIWVSVFSRNGLKFVRNEAGVSNLTTFHCIYLTGLFIDVDVFFAYLLTDVAQKIFLDNSRQYGNGLTKFEPNDLNNAKVVDFYKLTEAQISEIKGLYSDFKSNGDQNTITKINNIFLKTFSKI